MAFTPEIRSVYGLITDDTIQPPSWDIEGWLGHRSLAIIGGPPKSRKSTILLDILTTLATGSPLGNMFGQWRPPVASVLLIQEENTLSRIKTEMTDVLVNHSIIDLEVDHDLGSSEVLDLTLGTSKRFDVVSNSGFDLTDKECWEWLVATITENGYEYIALDPLYMVAGGVDANKAIEIVPVLKALTWLRENLEVGVIVVHHQSEKGDKTGKSQGAKLLGSTYLHGWYECGIFPRQVEGVMEVSVEFREHPVPDEPYRFIIEEPGRWRPVTADEVLDAVGKLSVPKAAKVTRKVEAENLLALGYTYKEIAEKLGISPATVRRYFLDT